MAGKRSQTRSNAASTSESHCSCDRDFIVMRRHLDLFVTMMLSHRQVPVLCYLGFFCIDDQDTSRGFQIVDALRDNRWRARGNMDRMAPAVVFELYFLFGRFTVVLHLDPIFSLAIAEGDDEPRPIFRDGGFN